MREGGLRQGGRGDWEGNRYWFFEDDIRNYFYEGQMELHPFRDGVPIITVRAGRGGAIDPSGNTFTLHSSSLHRLWLAGKISHQI
jgi:hypothetical protein